MIVSTKKYACETCIKGHRSSACKHTDRPLFEIKKKGRPVTQCEHCRELRKTKQVHVKCLCESKAPEPSSSHVHPSGFERAAFPNGLPQALEASVAFQSQGEVSSSDDDHGGVVHKCKSGDPCRCIMPKPKGSRKSSSDHAPAASGSSSSAAIMNRIAELRPVLPRPPDGGPVHNPSSGVAHSHPNRHHENGPQPYKVAYGMAHQHLPMQHHQSYASPGPSNLTSTSFTFNDDQNFAEQMQMMGVNPWAVNQAPSSGDLDLDTTNLTFPSLCGCGDDCNCPGCFHHNNRATATPSSSSAYASCTNPGACGTCLDCTILSLPASTILPDDTALSIHNSNEPIAEWLRQLSTSDFLDPSNSFQQPGFPDFNQQNWSLMNPSEQPSYMQPDFSFGADMSGQAVRGGFPQSQSHRRSQSSMSNIDPLLIPSVPRAQFLALPNSDLSRSRSPSTSSQSSHQDSELSFGGAAPSVGRGPTPPYRPSGRVQGMFNNTQGVRSAPQLNISVPIPSSSSRPVMSRSTNSAGGVSLSVPNQSPGGFSSGRRSALGSASATASARPPYASSNPETETGASDQQYDPSSLAGLNIY